MPNDQRAKGQGSSHQAASSSVSWWQKYHFSGKVIMCSVLFGLGLVLIGGLLTAIGISRNDEAHNKNLSEIQNKAPMSIVGFIIIGIGSFTVVVGVTMCLFETNICRKRQPDVRPLIDDQSKNPTNSDPTAIPSTSQKKGKHRHHKKHTSPRKHGKTSQPSTPIDVHRSISGALTASDKFVTPSSSLINEHVKVQVTNSDAEIQTSASLLNSFMSSGKSSELDFQTPSSSLRDSPGSFQNQNELQGIPPENSNTEVHATNRLKDLKHDFLTPKSSNAEILDSNSESEDETVLADIQQTKDHSDLVLEALNQKGLLHERGILSHDFVTPMNSYVEQPQLPDKIAENQTGNSNVLENQECAIVHKELDKNDSSHLESIASSALDNKNNSKPDRLTNDEKTSTLDICVEEVLVQHVTDSVADNTKDNELLG